MISRRCFIVACRKQVVTTDDVVTAPSRQVVIAAISVDDIVGIIAGHIQVFRARQYEFFDIVIKFRDADRGIDCVHPARAAQGLDHTISDIVNIIDIIPGAARHDVSPQAAIQSVIANAAKQRIRAVATQQRVIAIATVERVVADAAIQRIIAITAKDVIVPSIAIDLVVAGKPGELIVVSVADDFVGGAISGS